jgi:hypothetical protein
MFYDPVKHALTAHIIASIHFFGANLLRLSVWLYRVVVAAGLPLAVVVVAHLVLGDLLWSEEVIPLLAGAPCSFSDPMRMGCHLVDL